jgi:MFS family permease
LIVLSSLWQSTACLLLAFVSQPQAALALVALNACGTAITNPLFLALVSTMVPERDLAAANSVQQGAVTIAMMAGPAIGGLLTGLTGGAQVPLLLDALVFVVVANVGLLIGTRRQPPQSAPGPRVGVAILFTDRILRAAVALAVLLPLVVHLIYVAQVYLVRDTFGASGLTFGLLQTTHMVGLLIGTGFASQLNTERRIVLVTPVSAAVMSVSIVLIGLLGSLPAAFALYVVAGISMSMVSVSVGTLLLLRTPDTAIGRVMASFTAVHRTAGLVAYGLGAIIVGSWRPEVVYMFAGAGSLIIVAALTPACRRAWVLTHQN